MDLDEQMEDDTHILTSAFIYNAKNKAPAHLIEEIQPNYDFDKAALQLQNSKRLLTYLKKVLSFLKNSNETNFVFFGVNGALEKFFIQILNDSNNLLSNLLDVKCKVVCKEIYDFLEENEGNLEVTVEFQIEEGKITLVYCKNYKSMPQTTSEEASTILHEALTNEMSKNEKLLQKYLIANEKRLKDVNEPLSETYMRTSLQKILYFIRDPSQVTLVFTDLNKNECKFVKSPKQVHKKKHLLDTQSRVLVTAINNALKGKKNWVLGVTERKARTDSLRDVIYEKKPNFDDRSREPNASDILKEGGLQDKNLASHAKLLIDLSTPVVSNNAVRIMKGMGWNGGALGIRGNGITEPIMPQVFRNVRSGLGHGVESKKNAPKKHVSSDFLINVFARTLDMITKGEDEVTCSSRIQLVNKERSYLNNIFTKLNQRDDAVVGSFGDKEYVTDILKAMNDDASLRLVAHLLDDSTVKIIRAKNYASVPPYTPGSNANEYVYTMVNSFGPFYIDDTGISKKLRLYDLFTLLLDLVANNYEMKMHISPFYFSHNDLTIIINVINHINKGKKYGGIFIDRVLFNQILEKVRGYFLDLEFDNVSNHQPENEDNSHLKNSFTIKKIHNKHVGLYRLLKSDNHKIDIVQTQSLPKVDEQQVNNLVEKINSDVNINESEEKVPPADENCNTKNNVFTDDVNIEICEKVNENELSSNLFEDEHGAAANDSINSPNEATSMDTECEVVVEENNTISCPGKDITQESNTNSCPCKDITRSFADQETQTDKFIDDEELKVQEAASNAVDQNDEVDDQNSALSIDSTDIKMKEEDLTDTDSVQSQEINEKVKNNSPSEWEQLQSDINNLHLVLRNEYMNSFLKDDQYKNLKRYKRDIEKNASKDKFTKTIKIVPLNYPEEGIDTRIVLRIQYLIMEAISEMEQPLLKCHGVKDGALLFSCFTEDSYKFLNKLLINTKTRIIDEKVELTRPRIFMRCNNYLGLSHNEIFSKLNMYNDIRTDGWKIEHFWNNDGFFTFVLEMDENSFEFIKDRGFSLFFGIDRAEFSVLWR